MSLRPVPARWFELLTARDDLTLTVETLARTQSVELETHSETTAPLTLPDLHEQLEEFNRLSQRYSPYWPADVRPSELPSQPDVALERSLRALEHWRRDAEATITALEALHSERGRLTRLEEWLRALDGTPLTLDRLSASGPTVAFRLIVLPAGTRIEQLPAGVLTTQVEGPHHKFLLALGRTEEVDQLEQELVLLKGRRVRLPPWLEPSADASLAHLQRRREAIAGEERELQTALEELERKHRLRHTLGDIHRVEWFVTHVESLPVTENFAWVTGWTSDASGQSIDTALEGAGVRALLRFPPAPEGKRPPMVMHNPWWARPFELFAQLLGTPSDKEADPSSILVLVVPLLFGYMFGDVGQGAVLFAAGLMLRRRWPATTLLLPAGFSSVVFGALFGSIFSREDVFPPLWLHPVAEPITILAIPLVGGVLLLLLGLSLAGIQAYWRKESRHWWLQDAPLILMYLSLIASFLHSAGPPAFGAGLAWYLLGAFVLGGGGSRVGHVLRAVAELVEKLMQLAINTLSFTRVGAFALAHAGLSAAVVSLADATESWFATALIMVIGNIVIIVLEGLVVSIQITRLVLFEFFIRFLRGEGRRFQPLSAPPSPSEQEKH